MIEIVIRETLHKYHRSLRLHWEFQDPSDGGMPIRRSRRTFGNSLDCYEDLGRVIRRALSRDGHLTGVPERINEETAIVFRDPEGREHQGTRLTIGSWLHDSVRQEPDASLAG